MNNYVLQSFPSTDSHYIQIFDEYTYNLVNFTLIE